jgi:hypothetical protein
MAPGGHFREVSLIERSTASPEALLAVAADPTRWATFVPTMKRSTTASGDNGMAAVEIEQALPLMNWTSKWAYKIERSAVELFALDGDLRGGHLRWDVDADGTGRTQLILRASANFQNGSMLLREVYKLEPYLEFGFDVALNLLLLRSVRQRAEAQSSNVTNSSPSPR